MLSDKAMRDRMKGGWHGGKGDGTVCGAGSTIGHSVNAIRWLPEICEKYDIQSVCDAGAGDLHWMKRVVWDVDYKGFDLFPRHPDVQKLDITTQNMPECDLVLCRFVLNHLFGHDGDKTRIFMALERFKKVSKYLVATNFVKRHDKNREFCGLNLREELGEPLEVINDGHEPNCTLELWRL